MDGKTITARPSKSTKRWWQEPFAIAFGALVLVASLAVIFENKIVPPKPIDPTARVVMPGGGSFCDPVPLPPASGDQNSAQK